MTNSELAERVAAIADHVTDNEYHIPLNASTDLREAAKRLEEDARTIRQLEETRNDLQTELADWREWYAGRRDP